MIYIDIGNTCINIKDFQKEYTLMTSTFIKEQQSLSFLKGDTAIISSVVPAATKKMQKLLQFEKIQPFFLEANTQNMIEIKTDDPTEVGSDLIACAIGSTAYSNNCVIIDLGTATKFIKVKNKCIEGVIIASGLETSAKGLIGNAALLKNFVLKKPQVLFGTNTEAALNAGFITGHLAMIEGIIQKIIAQYGEIDIFITGGLAHYVSDDLAYEHFDNLVIKGLMLYESRMNYALEKNKKC